MKKEEIELYNCEEKGCIIHQMQLKYREHEAREMFGDDFKCFCGKILQIVKN